MGSEQQNSAIRIRFHGRGGHGVKTASRILGTAAFLAGYHSQDSPIYGAERRGAPVTAFTRIDKQPILERGMIESPDLILVADDTLLHEPTAGVLAGQDSASALFVNSATAITDEFVERYGIRVPVAALDITSRTIEALGRASALSAGLGAAATRLVGSISREQLLAAMRDELEHLEVPADQIQKNIDLASDVFSALAPVEFSRGPAQQQPAIQHVAYDSPTVGSPSVIAQGNAESRDTGAWRVERPEIDYDRCTRCSLCFVRCPDGAISLDEHGYPIIDYDHCKGCMICRQICPVHGIHAEKETEAW